ncbi:MAG: hypothetical protein PVS2B2_18350 [Candidatus Acidiferrum sp.]
MHSPQGKSLIWIACGFLAAEVAAALLFPTSYALTVAGELFPVILMVLAIFGFRQNWLRSSGLLRSFWLLNGIGFGIMLLSQFYSAYYDFRYAQQPDNSIPGDALFLLSLIPVLAALALQPHSHSQSRRLRFRHIDFFLLTTWWFCLFVYFAVPWQYVVRNMMIYNRVVYLLLFVEHSAVTIICAFWARRSTQAWRNFYYHLFISFLLFALGNLLISIAFEKQVYYSGSLFDIPWSASLVWIVVAIHAGRNLGASPQADEIDEGRHGLWITRLAMLALLSLPALAIWSYVYSLAPSSIVQFRLRLAFSAMLPLGALVILKIRLLNGELLRQVERTANAVQHLQAVQAKLSQSQKMAALGRLASGATHEISNPLTAILGYSELLADNPALSAEELGHVSQIQQQVHRAQAAVVSMRGLDRSPDSLPTSLPSKTSPE